MAKYRKLGRTSAQRKALLRNQVTAVINNGKIVTTEAKAKEVQKIVDGLIALAVKEKDNFETVKVTTKVARKDKDGNFIWPGFGDNMRVLDWIIKRCEGTVDAVETPIGYEPKAEDINVDGLVYEGKQFTSDDIADLLKLDMDKWESEITEMRRYYDEDIKAKGGNIPAALYEQLDKLEDRIKKAAK